jgi:hypothetical protein
LNVFYADDWFAYPHLAVPYKMKVIVDTRSKCKATYKSLTDEMMCTKGNGRAANGQCIIGNVFFFLNAIILKRCRK